ncbi:hypothetical protein GCM10009550_77040 [Actinocorallia libanotica]|uniref:DoxX-like protein n=2 Tax=Actinocorallia libanotica TaxID=46162 RepID=A0ABP4CHY5_9ACTN
MKDMRARLSTLWIFAMLNYLYCDIVGLMDSGQLRQFLAGRVGGMDIGQEFLLGASVLMELPIAMIVLSRLLKHRANRLANIVVGSVMTVVQTATLFTGSPAAYYVFFSVIEIACTVLIVRCAWTWRVETIAPAARPAPTAG